MSSRWVLAHPCSEQRHRLIRETSVQISLIRNLLDLSWSVPEASTARATETFPQFAFSPERSRTTLRSSEQRLTKVISLAGPFMGERQEYVCGAEIVQFVGNRWKRNIPRRRSRAPAVNSSGRASVLSQVSTRRSRWVAPRVLLVRFPR